jgi:hypothetical protein
VLLNSQGRKRSGWVLDRAGSFAPVFALGGSAYLLALLVVHVLSPRLAPARIGWQHSAQADTGRLDA